MIADFFLSIIAHSSALADQMHSSPTFAVALAA